VRILVRRRGWQRIIPNAKGQPTVVVIPTEELEAEHERRAQDPDDGGTTADVVSNIGIAGAVALLDRTLSRLVEAERRADDALRRAEQAEKTAEAAQIGRAEALQALEELRQARAKRAGQGRWARLRAAWRG
jgi:hypothetical protein